VAVDDENLLPSDGMFEDEPFVGDEPILLDLVAERAVQVVVAQQQVQAAMPVELVQQFEGSRVGGADIGHLPVVPQLIAVTDLHVGKGLSVVALQDAAEQPLVRGKGIGGAAIAAVTVAEEHDPRIVVKGYARRTAQYLVQATVSDGDTIDGRQREAGARERRDRDPVAGCRHQGGIPSLCLGRASSSITSIRAFF
jgi:hypothetical protein